jgi:hypothetical protein
MLQHAILPKFNITTLSKVIATLLNDRATNIQGVTLLKFLDVKCFTAMDIWPSNSSKLFTYISLHSKEVRKFGNLLFRKM